jgi:hypothetical protein
LDDDRPVADSRVRGRRRRRVRGWHKQCEDKECRKGWSMVSQRESPIKLHLLIMALNIVGFGPVLAYNVAISQA